VVGAMDPADVLEKIRFLLEQHQDRAFDRISIKCRGRTIFVDPNEIRWVESAKNYLKVHGQSETYITRGTLADLDKRLDPRRFVRIHRSVIVNTEHIREIKPWYTGEYVLVLIDGKELTISRGHRSAIAQITAALGLSEVGECQSLVIERFMKYQCERCATHLPGNTVAFICSYICTFCPGCAEANQYVCPNCNGELVQRPRRNTG
jgi:hypothetical protein